MKLLNNFFNTLLLIFVLSVSCTSDDREQAIVLPEGDYNQGLFILNEGGYGYSNASVSFLDTDGQVYNSIFSGVNNMNLGDTAQSMGFYGDNAYIVVNNSSTIEIVNRYTFQYIATVSDDIVNPRYIVFDGNKGYITNWGDPNNVNDDYVAVLNLDTNLVEYKIPVAEGPEKLVSNNGKIYVAHTGGYGYGNTISVIDIVSEKVISSIGVGDVPDDLLIDSDKLYVICSGKPDYALNETSGQLIKIGLSSGAVESELTFPQIKHPRFLDIDGGVLYYILENSIYTVNTSNFQLPQTDLFSLAVSGVKTPYGFKIHENKIYIADAKDYVSNGEVFIYNLTGEIQKKFTVQIIPNSFYFNN
ncbi:YncE family protein [Mariniflexile litorale]|uniref:YncE family protein n=1 Tax=Mariniflexile litorale TaxID=3045158 RepID=A0AAU7EH54_9FLAO|nr:YncE family protein [Mariniflexile sp. KMM 9835]MDQ8210772.1 YncE family protein [Mariniflexile sp. KMM 9835]